MKGNSIKDMIGSSTASNFDNIALTLRTCYTGLCFLANIFLGGDDHER